MNRYVIHNKDYTEGKSRYCKFTLMVDRNKKHFSTIYVYAGGLEGYKIGSRKVMNENLDYVINILSDFLERGLLFQVLDMLDGWETEKEKWNRENGIETVELSMV